MDETARNFLQRADSNVSNARQIALKTLSLTDETQLQRQAMAHAVATLATYIRMLTSAIDQSPQDVTVVEELPKAMHNVTALIDDVERLLDVPGTERTLVWMDFDEAVEVLQVAVRTFAERNFS